MLVFPEVSDGENESSWTQRRSRIGKPPTEAVDFELDGFLPTHEPRSGADPATRQSCRRVAVVGRDHHRDSDQIRDFWLQQIARWRPRGCHRPPCDRSFRRECPKRKPRLRNAPEPSAKTAADTVRLSDPLILHQTRPCRGSFLRHPGPLLQY